MENQSMNLDILVFAAHPDDTELGMSGQLQSLRGENPPTNNLDAILNCLH